MKRRVTLGRLKAAGFDDSYKDGDNFTVRCSQCDALVINKVPCHELGCPNMKKAIEKGKSWSPRK